MNCGRALILTALLAGSATVLWSQDLSSFSYQGQLKESGGPADGFYDFTFKLFDAAEGGRQVGATFNTNRVAVANGIFSVAVDFGAGAFNGAARWIEIAVKSNGLAIPPTGLTPRHPITPAPMAQFALTPAGPTGPQGPAGPQGSPGSADAWSRVGNAGTTAGANFLGTTDNQALELRVNGNRALLVRPHPSSSPNLIGGYQGNVVSNEVLGATIGGGGFAGAVNAVGDNYGTVSGGLSNRALGNHATVSGGDSNVGRDMGSTIGGGALNSTALYSVVSGGYSNVASGPYAAIGGGQNHSIVGNHSVIAGGNANSCGSNAAFIGGGTLNHADGSSSTLAGGYDNTVSGDVSFIGGGARNRVSSIFSVLGGGEKNRITGDYASIGGGLDNQVINFGCTVGGGEANSAGGGFFGGSRATVGGGYQR